jgi:hypothetical protein
MKAFSGRLYRPDVAPADAPVTAPEQVEPPPPRPNDPPQQATAPASDEAFPRLALNNPFFEASPAKRK